MACLRTAVVAALLLLSGCTADPEVRSVVLVTLDTTRADRIGCYGYKGGATPNLDRLAAEGARFEQCGSPVPITLPAHASMFTGMYPPSHGVHYNTGFRLPDTATTVAEILLGAGWRTAAFPAAYPVAAKTGVGQGFELYLDLFSRQGAPKPTAESARSAAEISRDVIGWLAGVGDEKFFAWVHFYDPHDPYEPPEPYRGRFAGREYDGEIAFVDHELGKIFEALAAARRWTDTLVIVVGDHGEGLGEHREPTHKNLVYESTLRVPLIVKTPGTTRSTVVTEPVSLVDLAPTILDFAGLGAPASMEGQTLRPALSGKPLPRRGLFFESLAGALSFGWAPLEGLRRGPWKLIDGPGRELYDLAADPHETENLAGTHRTTAEELAAELQDARDRWAASVKENSAATPIDAESRERLASLGYVGGVMSESARRGRNPRELAHLETPIDEGRRRMKAGDWPGALNQFRTVLAEDPDNHYALGQAAQAAIALGDGESALAWSRRLTEVNPDDVDSWQILGAVHATLDDHDAEVVALERALAIRPDEGGLRFRLVLARFLAGDSRGALRSAEDAVAAEPGVPHPNILAVAAAARADLGDVAGASRTLEEAVEQGFRDPRAFESERAFAPLRALPAYRELFLGPSR